MANLAVTIPSSLEVAVRDLSTRRRTSVDDLVGAVLSEYVQSSPRRMYQISTSTALVEGVYSGAVSSSTLLQHGDFGVGTFEGLDGEMVILDGEMYQAAGNVQRRTDDFLSMQESHHFWGTTFRRGTGQRTLHGPAADDSQTAASEVGRGEGRTQTTHA
jgi:Alpha-acetolactate decarboxylase